MILFILSYTIMFPAMKGLIRFYSPSLFVVYWIKLHMWISFHISSCDKHNLFVTSLRCCSGKIYISQNTIFIFLSYLTKNAITMLYISMESLIFSCNSEMVASDIWMNEWMTVLGYREICWWFPKPFETRITNSMQSFPQDPHSSFDIYSNYFSNSGAFASELLEHFEEMFPRYYMYGDIDCMVKCSTTQ